MISTDYSIPITENCVFAIRLDMNKKTEEILIGELKDIKQRLDGYSKLPLLYEKTRDIGRLILDYAPIADDLANIRVVLSDSTSQRKTPYFDREINNLKAYYGSDNPLHRFTALLMWQEYHHAKNDTSASEAIMDTFDDITLALRFNLIENVKDWQERNRKNPLEYLDSNYRKYPVSLFYGADRHTSEYAVTDKSLLSIAVYYLKQVYNSGRYIQTCPICGSSFVAKTIGMTTLCSDNCRRIQGKENKRRFDERTRDISYERSAKNTYMYWYNKVAKCRGMDLPKDKIEKLESAFLFFGQVSAKRKKAIGKDKARASEYESWLLMQRNIIDDLLKEMGL